MSEKNCGGRNGKHYFNKEFALPPSWYFWASESKFSKTTHDIKNSKQLNDEKSALERAVHVL